MKQPDNHIDAVLENLVPAINHSQSLQETEQILKTAQRQIEDFYRNKIPKKKYLPKKIMPADYEDNAEAIGYNQAIDDIIAQFNRGDSDE